MTRTTSLIDLKALIILMIVLTSCNKRAEVYQWRGDNRDGIYNEVELLDQWPEGGPELLWSTEGLGIGYAAPVITKDKIFVNGTIDSISHLFAFNLEGNLLWKTPNGEQFVGEGFSATYPGARSTPTVVDDLVYSISGKGRIICCEINTGEPVWEVDMINDLDGYLPYFGIAESPLIIDEKIFCYPSGQENNLAALNRLTGETVWTSPALKDTASFCSPIILDFEDNSVIVTMSHYYLIGINPDDGQVLWKYYIEGYEAEGDHCNTPVFYNGDLYQVFGDRKSNGALKLELSADGRNATEVWTNQDARNNFSGFIMHDNRMFTTVRGNQLKVLELEQGNIVDSLKVSTGAIVMSDSKFFIYGYNGEVNLINYLDGKLIEGGSFKVDQGSGQHFSHPVISNGVMYIRHGDALMAYEIK